MMSFQAFSLAGAVTAIIFVIFLLGYQAGARGLDYRPVQFKAEADALALRFAKAMSRIPEWGEAHPQQAAYWLEKAKELIVSFLDPLADIDRRTQVDGLMAEVSRLRTLLEKDLAS